MELVLDARQLPLFGRNQRRPKPKRRRSRLVVIIERVIGWIQLELDLPAPVDPFADDDFDFPRRRIVRAADEPAPRTRAVASIFALAESLRSQSRKPAAFVPSAPAALHAVAVQRADGITRMVGGMYPSNRMTPEKEEAERARRARQRPPKPTMAAKTRGRKVREWDGETFE